MNITKCIVCDNLLKNNSKFCGQCGSQVKCFECNEPYLSGNNFCEKCGTEIPKKAANNISQNRIKFHENSQGRFFEAEFTDEVGKDLTGTLGEILTVRQLALGGYENTISNSGSISETPTKGNNEGKITEDISFEDASTQINSAGKPRSSSQSTVSKVNSKSSKKANSASDELKMLDDLDLNPKNGQGLKDFVSQYKASSNYERNLIYTYYLKEVLKLQEPVNYNHIYTCYRWLDEKFPNAFLQSIKDTKSNKQWLSYSKLTDIKVSPKGMNQIKDLKVT
jgi:hypothetical protein